MPADGLIARHVQFVGALRGAGLPVSLVESLDATQAMAVIDLMDREQLRAAYAAAVVKRAPHRATFDRLFDLWWPPAIGDGEAARSQAGDGEAADGELQEIDPADLDAMKQMIEQVDFLRASRDEIAELRRRVYPLARRLATRLTAKRRLGRTGRLDVRRTVRASLSSGGVPLTTIHKPHKPHKPELVVLCDVSGSVASFAHFTVLLAYALREQFAKVRVFAFVDTCDEVTRFFEHGGDVADALARMAQEADVVWFDGHSDYGHSFEVFSQKWPEAVTPKTSLLILGDARSNYRALSLPALRSAVHHARHAYWLNPEPRQYWGSGDSAASAYGDVVPMIECRNAAQLEEFVENLLPV